MIIDPLTSRIVYETGFETRAFLVLNSLLNKSVISDVKAVRRRPSYAPSLLGPSAWLQHGFSMASASGLTCGRVGSLALTVQFMYNLGEV